MGQRGFWDEQARQQKLSEKKPLLDQINQLVPWEDFRPLLSQVHEKPRKSHAGRKPIDVILMFKLLLLQHLYSISDEELEYQVNDRLTFMRFLGLGIEDRVPDAKTVWLFRQQLTERGLIPELFEQFETHLRQAGYSAKSGQIVDATLIPVPKQRISKAERQQLEQGEIPSAWQAQPHRLAQTDRDARWTKKNGVSHFGYKSHVCIDVEYGFVRRYQLTDAAVHDSQVLGGLLDGENEADPIWADSAYRSQAIEWTLERIGFDSFIHERAYRHRPLSEAQIANNRTKSSIRAKVEHVFGDWVMSMGGKLLRSIGLARAEAHIGLKILAYNIKRLTYWEFRATC